MDKIASEWERLCNQHEKAKDAYNKTFAPVHAGFRGVFAGNSNANPSISQMRRAEKAWKDWQDIIRRMRAFAKKHA